ncbi:hypothetical protein BH09SUM1_BH09SUM1_33490 [soil metagenome]
MPRGGGKFSNQMKNLLLSLTLAAGAVHAAAPAATTALDKALPSNGVLNLNADDLLTGGIIISHDTIIHGASNKAAGTTSSIKLGPGESIVVLSGVKLTLENVNIDASDPSAPVVEIKAGAHGVFNKTTITGGSRAYSFGLGSDGVVTDLIATGQVEAIAHAGNGRLTVTGATISNSSHASILLAHDSASTSMIANLTTVTMSSAPYGILAERYSSIVLNQVSLSSYSTAIHGPLDLSAYNSDFRNNTTHIDAKYDGTNQPYLNLNDDFFGQGTTAVKLDHGRGSLIATSTFEDQSAGIVLTGETAAPPNNPFTIRQNTFNRISGYSISAVGGGSILTYNCFFNDCKNPVNFEGTDYLGVSSYVIENASTDDLGVAVRLRDVASGSVNNIHAVGYQHGIDGEHLGDSDHYFFIEDSTIEDSTSSGVRVVDHSRLALYRLVVTFSAEEGIIVGSGESDATSANVSENHVTSSGLDDSTGGHGGGILLSGAGPFNASANVITDSVGPALMINGSGNDNIIERNLIMGNEGTGLSLLNSGDILISDNAITGTLAPGQAGISIANSSNLLLTRNLIASNAAGIVTSGSANGISGTGNVIVRSVGKGIDVNAGTVNFSTSAFIDNGDYQAFISSPTQSIFSNSVFAGINKKGLFTNRGSCAAPSGNRTTATNNFWNDGAGPQDNCIGPSPDSRMEYQNADVTPFLNASPLDFYYSGDPVRGVSPSIVSVGATPWVSVTLPEVTTPDHTLAMLRAPVTDAPPPGVTDSRAITMYVGPALVAGPPTLLSIRFAGMAGIGRGKFEHVQSDTGGIDIEAPTFVDGSDLIVRMSSTRLASGQWYFASTQASAPDLAFVRFSQVSFAELDSEGTFRIRGGSGYSDRYVFSSAVGIQSIAGNFDGSDKTTFGYVKGEEFYYPKYDVRDDLQPRSYGWKFSPSTGWRAFAGDFNGDGYTDVLQMTEYRDRVWVGLNNGSSIPAPSPSQLLGFRYSPAGHFWIGVADVNGDGRDDLVQATPYGDAWVSIANAAGNFDGVEKWGVTGYRWDLNEHYGILLGDFNGDGKSDLAQVTPFGDAWVAISTGNSFTTPTKWGHLGFSDAYADNATDSSAAFAVDLNGDGTDDLIDLTQYGNVWGAQSTGSAFLDPASVSSGFAFGHDSVEGPRQLFVGNFVSTIP